MEAFLRQTWVDPRLNYEHLSNFSNLELDQRMMGDVWVPDTYFPNEKEAHFHVVTVPNRLLHINRNGTVFYSIRWVSFKVRGAEASILCFPVFVDLLLKDANNLIFMVHILRIATYNLVYTFIFSFCRLSLTLTCRMNLYNYPMDEQNCPIYIETCKSVFKRKLIEIID